MHWFENNSCFKTRFADFWFCLLEDEGIVTGAMVTETVTVAMEVATIGVTGKEFEQAEKPLV